MGQAETSLVEHSAFLYRPETVTVIGWSRTSDIFAAAFSSIAPRH